VARPDYSFADGDGPAEETTAEGGSHGYLNTDPRMQAVLVAWGAGIRRGARIGSVSNLDVAPTVAKLLHIRLPQADGRPMDAILSER
jgi:predicted AlkP superfamily pyrophosphatase or phosphodiesterase